MTMDAELPPYATSPYKHGTKHYRSLLEQFGELNQGRDERKRKDIAILGSGMAGLIAGFLLKKLGHNVKIYEASNTVGGRIKTLRDRFTAGFYAEAGAMRIPSHHTLALDLVETFDLPCLKFPAVCPDGNTYYINNQWETFGNYGRKKPDFGFKLEEWERDRTADDLLQDAVLRYLGEIGWPDVTYQALNHDRSLGDVEAIARHLDCFHSMNFYASLPLLVKRTGVTRRARSSPKLEEIIFVR
jgi:hypothetical protein